MDKARWARIRELFGHVAEKSASHRSEYLDMVCEGDTELREEVEDLLCAHDQVTLVDPGRSIEPVAATTQLERVGNYRILDTIGVGGMGTVYRAQHDTYGEVALKLLPRYAVNDVTAEKRFHLEAQALGAIEHPALCRLFECFVTDAYVGIAMELIEGRELAEVIAFEPMSFQAALDVVATLTDVLALAHSHDIVHRDLKPANVLLTADGSVKLIDFGIAKFADQKLTATGQILGTPSYMSPEQWRGEAMDARTDLWALGVLWHQMLTGKPPFPGADMGEIADAVLKNEATRLPRNSSDGVSLKRVGPLLDRLLQKDPAKRPTSCGELRAELVKLR